MNISYLNEILFLSLIIVIFCNFLVQFSFWILWLNVIRNKLKIFNIGKFIYKWGTCIKCITFWISVVIFGLYYFYFKQNFNIILFIMSILFTTTLSRMVYRFINKKPY
ncbi:MAG: hypothetical protein KatS3mg129_2170 [Leptospiraceae bacterium]|nr:MAG: hypothetical protein KatS3mg129_2170 [Leptospiraceae bacterium]